MQGGRVYGQGLYGRTMDAAQIHGDQDTMHAMLSSMTPKDRARCYAWGPDGRKRTQLKVEQLDALAAIVATSKNKVAKLMHAGPNTRAVFKAEMHAMALVRSAFGENLENCTTLQSLFLPSPIKGRQPMEVAGIETPSGFYIMSGKCDTPLDKFKFTQKNVAGFVRDILFGFSTLHAGNVLHCDVKLDNMIYCASERRFKLIDWGASDTMPAVRKRYMDVERPKNTSSPFAWFAWGLGAAASVVYMSFHALKYAGDMVGCSDYRSLILSARDSFESAYDKLVEANKTKNKKGNGKMDEEALRRHVLDRYVRSFDLFSFGFILAHIACSGDKELTTGMRQRLLKLARRLTHYDDPDFTQDAADALKHF
jgi:serine/threonine protein kinase